jgi:hypothetical protein
MGQKIAKSQFLRKVQNRFIGSILRVQSISVALVDPFFLDRAHHWKTPHRLSNQEFEL